MKLICVHLRVALFHLIEKVKVWLFYRSYAKIDLLFSLSYLFSSPFRISKRFLKERGESNFYAYGETPLTTWDKIANECGILSSDCVYDLGCGRGTGIFWLASEIGCRAVGIEIIPTFVHKGQSIKRWSGSSRATLRCEDMLQSDLSGATLIYIDGILLEEKVWEELLKTFSRLKPGTKIVTVSEPLPAPFGCIKEFEGRFPWGKTTLHLNHLVVC